MMLRVKIIIKIIRNSLPVNKRMSERKLLLSEIFSLLAYSNKINLNLIFFQFLIVIGEMGSGKTSLIPFLLLLHRFNINSKILITQPKRVCVLSSSIRVCNLIKTNIGKIIGIKMRYFKLNNKQTKMFFMTECTLINNIVNGRYFLLNEYIIIDEIHERSLFSDILCGLLFRLKSVNYPVKFLVMTATISLKKFYSTMKPDKILLIKGRICNSNSYFLRKSVTNYLVCCFLTIRKLLGISGASGDLLIFLSGKDDILFLRSLLKFDRMIYTTTKNLDIKMLYSDYLNFLNVKSVVDTNKLTIYLSTNLAETSITLERLKYIIDTGYVKNNYYVKRYDSNILKLSIISKLESLQRLGRIGRTQIGYVFRLYDKNSFENMHKNKIPEILKVDLAQMILFSKCIGIKNFSCLDWLDIPSYYSIQNAYKNLLFLNLLDIVGLHITVLGRLCSTMPVGLKCSRIFFEAILNKCTFSFLFIVSLLNSYIENLEINFNNIFKIFKNKIKIESDFLILIKVFYSYVKLPKVIQIYYIQRLKLNHTLIRNSLKTYKIFRQILNKLNISISNNKSPIVIHFTFFVTSYYSTSLYKENNLMSLKGELRCKISSLSILNKKNLKITIMRKRAICYYKLKISKINILVVNMIFPINWYLFV